jgi:glutamine amidotransferase
MSSRYAADVHFSFEAFSRRGGLAGPHKDGWGIAYYVDEDVRLVKEPQASSESACVRYLQEYPFAAPIVLSHIRRATRGALALKNCQPFARELGGRMHVFAHNGDLDLARLRAGRPLDGYRPVGETDSEHAFCVLLGLMRQCWLDATLPPLEARLDIVAGFAARLRALGPANFLYSDGEALFVHGHRRLHGDGRGATPPGLHLLCRRCAGQRGSGIDAEGLSIGLGVEQEVVLAASVPLTDEPGWQALAEGEVVAIRAGRIVERRAA